MRRTAELFALAREWGIVVRWKRLRPQFEGVYLYEPSKGAYIYLEPELIDDPPRLRVILAEELGHHVTLGGAGAVFLPGRPEWNTAEARAWHWAAHYLVPEAELLWAYDQRLNLLDMAIYFGVPLDWMRRRLKHRP